MSYSSEVLADSPMAYYRLGDTSGTTMTDSSGNARHGTYTGSPGLNTTGLLTGDADKCVDFAANQYGSFTPPDLSLNASSVTVEAIINLDTTSSVHDIVGRRNAGSASTNETWQLRVLSTGKLDFFYVTGSSYVTTQQSTATLSTGTTYHVAATYDGANVKLYINGSLDSTFARTGTPNSTTSPIRIGFSGFGSPNQEYFDGRIDEVAVYGSALSGTRIAAHYSAMTAGVSGTFAATNPKPTASFTGSFTPAPETGTFAATAPVPVASFTGTYSRPEGTFDATLPVPTASFSGSYVGSIAATFDAVLLVPTAAFTGTYTPPAITGTFDATLPVPAVSFTGSASLASGSFDATLPLPTVEFTGSYGGPYPTDTSNARHGRRRLAYATVTVTQPVAAPPATVTLASKVDKALAYPTPTMVDGRPT